MSLLLRSLLCFTAIACGAGSLAEAQTVRRILKHVFCHKCGLCRDDCHCAQAAYLPPPIAPAAICPPAAQTVGAPVSQSCTQTCTTVHPVVETRYRQENVMTYQNVTCTAYRQEAYCETVPATQVENVTVDEGHYQMVWVPKPVTHQVAKTVYQQRMATRNVPYQYCKQVPQMSTRVVPEQTVRYVQRTQTYNVPMQPVCPPMLSTEAVFAPTFETAALPAPMIAPDPTCDVPTPGGYPAGQPPLTPATEGVPSARTGAPWTQVPQRAAAPVQGTAYQPLRATAWQGQTVPTPRGTAPTAAAVWRTRH